MYILKHNNIEKPNYECVTNCTKYRAFCGSGATMIMIVDDNQVHTVTIAEF